jgi:hypothetical protein
VGPPLNIIILNHNFSLLSVLSSEYGNGVIGSDIISSTELPDIDTLPQQPSVAASTADSGVPSVANSDAGSSKPTLKFRLKLGGRASSTSSAGGAGTSSPRSRSHVNH